MALALCHILPRDNFMRGCVVLTIASFILMLVAFSKHADSRVLGAFEGGSPRRMLAEVTGATIVSAAAGALRLCPPLSDAELRALPRVTAADNATAAFFEEQFTAAMRARCSSFEHLTHAAAYTHIAATVLMFVATVVILTAIVPCAAKTKQMIALFWLSVLLPTALMVVGTALFDARARRRAREFLELALAPPDADDLTFKFGAGWNLAIAATALMCLALLLATARVAYAVLLRNKAKRAVIGRKDLGGLMQMHLVNDDWFRQKAMWALHAKEVECDIVVVSQQEHQPSDGGDSGSTPEVCGQSPQPQAPQTAPSPAPTAATMAARPGGHHRRTLSICTADLAATRGSRDRDKYRNDDDDDDAIDEPHSPVYVHRREASGITDDMLTRQVARHHDAEAEDVARRRQGASKQQQQQQRRQHSPANEPFPLPSSSWQ